MLKDETMVCICGAGLGMLGDKQSSVINGLASLITDSDAQASPRRSERLHGSNPDRTWGSH